MNDSVKVYWHSLLTIISSTIITNVIIINTWIRFINFLSYSEITVNERMTDDADADSAEIASSYYVLLELTVTWRGPSVVS